MKRNSTIYFTFALLLGVIVFSSSSSGYGAANDDDKTGSPLSSGVCGGCHSGGTAAFGTATATITVLNGSTPVTTYTPGQTYTVNLQITSSMGTPQFGGQLVALNSTNAQAGLLASPSTANTQISTLFSTIQYLEHSSRSTTGIFTASWTAPATGTGNVTFYASGNAVNATGGTSGDVGAPSRSLMLTEAALPVGLSSFVGKVNEDKSVLLRWVTSSEQSSKYFEVERSKNGYHYEPIKRIAAAGISTNELNYNFVDTNPGFGTIYYRLKQVDVNGFTAYFNAISVEVEQIAKDKNLLYPTINSGRFNVQINSDQDAEHIFSIFDLCGKVVASQRKVLQKGTQTVDFDLNITKGTYFLVDQNNKLESLPFVVQ